MNHPHYSMKRTIALVLGGALLLASSCNKDDSSVNPPTDSGKISTKESVEVLRSTVSASGGTITVSKAGSAVDGMTITQQSGSYPTSREYVVSTADITDHQFGSLFHPISPLIEIKNGGAYSDRLIRVKIPVTVPQDRGVMAFYYDRAKGTLEGIPTLARGADYIEIGVRHFSLIVLSDFQKEALIGGGGFHTLFDPQVNGWSFPNYGTYPEDGGICAGMSIGAIYFYQNFSASLLIKSFFDNDQLWFQTPDTWEDDAKGLKFTTEIQSVFISGPKWDSNENIVPILQSAEEDRFWNILYSMLVINRPQLIHLSSSSVFVAHAIVAYAYTINSSEATISIYDPNNPGLEGTIRFDLATKTFHTYASSTKVGSSGQTANFENIAYLPLSTICSISELDAIWAKVGNNTIGNGVFPQYTLYAVPTDPQFQRVKLEPAKENTSIGLPFDEFDIEIDVPGASGYKLVSRYVLPGLGTEKKDPIQTIKLEYPDNLIGIEIQAKPVGSSEYSWVGFHWFKLRKQSLWIEPADTTVAMNQPLELVARTNGSAPKQARFEWDFGDNKAQNVMNDSTVTHAYEQSGEYTVTVNLIDVQTAKSVGSAMAVVHVGLFNEIAVTLLGMDSNPPSTIKISDGTNLIDLPSIAFSNKVGNAPPLTWNGKNFEVEHNFRQSNVDWSVRISGRLSDDGKSIATLTAIRTGVMPGTDYNHTSSIVLTNFPIAGIGDNTIMGGELVGPAAQAKVSNVAFNQGTSTYRTILESIDWSSSKTKLSVWFYQ